LLLASPAAAETLPEAINGTALHTPVSRDGDQVLLYGHPTNGADTRYGRWACVKVTTIVLRQAGVPIPVLHSVPQVEAALHGWRRIPDQSALRPGDVVVWTSRLHGNTDGGCSGYGTCHVGIFTDQGYFHNSPIRWSPVFNRIGLWAFRFKEAFRPPG
jgi:hypothetical protein